MPATNLISSELNKILSSITSSPLIMLLHVIGVVLVVVKISFITVNPLQTFLHFYTYFLSFYPADKTDLKYYNLLLFLRYLLCRFIASSEYLASLLNYIALVFLKPSNKNIIFLFFLLVYYFLLGCYVPLDSSLVFVCTKFIVTFSFAPYIASWIYVLTAHCSNHFIKMLLMLVFLCVLIVDKIYPPVARDITTFCPRYQSPPS